MPIVIKEFGSVQFRMVSGRKWSRLSLDRGFCDCFNTSCRFGHVFLASCCASTLVHFAIIAEVAKRWLQIFNDPHYELIGYSIYLCHGRWTDCHISATSSHSPLLRLSAVKPFRTAKGQMASGVKTEERLAGVIWQMLCHSGAPQS